MENKISQQYRIYLSFNGQQFQNGSFNIVFYKIEITKVEPYYCCEQGSTIIELMGKDLFDSPYLSIALVSGDHERPIEGNFKEETQSIQFLCPPRDWVVKQEALLEEEVLIKLSFSG